MGPASAGDGVWIAPVVAVRLAFPVAEPDSLWPCRRSLNAAAELLHVSHVLRRPLHRRFRLLAGCGLDRRAVLQSPVHRASLGDLDQPNPLIGGQLVTSTWNAPSPVSSTLTKPD